jgi:hypothetical protein
MRFMGGINACCGGYAASSYYIQRVREIEVQVHAVFKEDPTISRRKMGYFKGLT